MASRSFNHFVEQELGKFPHFLIYAFLEWVMIILLFIDGFLAFISNEFAKFFELRIPCLLCTRIDHILVHKNYDFYYNESICEGHKKDISSLAYCHVHRKLSDIRGMCEGCLLSFATEKESDTDTYKSLVGILHKDIDCFVEDDPKLYLKTAKKDDVLQFERSYIKRCSCCGEPLKMRPTKGCSRSLSMNNASVQSIGPTPSPRAPTVAWRNGEGRNLELSQIKLMSDNELEVPDYEDGLNSDNHHSVDISEDASKTPSFGRGNKFFGIPLTDSAAASPRWSSRLPRKVQLEKSELFSESNDSNAEKEVDDDSIVHRLKRQVRLDRKSLIALYMELDEERSASTVAANNAMAMITRLQAEKAAVQMEALQYQRMMEEQAEYDQEAIQVLKDTLLKREDEIKVLEADLEIYREKYGHISKVCSDECEVDAEDYQEMKSHSFSSEKSDSGSPVENERTSERQGENGGEILDESSLDFENERSYLMSVVANLEKKINMSLDEGAHSAESSSDMVKQDNKDEGHVNKATLKREMSLIRERLRSIEADSGFLKHSAMTLQKGGEGTKLLTEIAQHLRKLRQLEKINETDA